MIKLRNLASEYRTRCKIPKSHPDNNRTENNNRHFIQSARFTFALHLLLNFRNRLCCISFKRGAHFVFLLCQLMVQRSVFAESCRFSGKKKTHNREKYNCQRHYQCCNTYRSYIIDDLLVASHSRSHENDECHNCQCLYPISPCKLFLISAESRADNSTNYDNADIQNYILHKTPP